MIKKIMCFLGFHYWIYITKSRKSNRECINCKRKEWFHAKFQIWTSDKKYRGSVED
jgi:hypothetical protein